MALVPCRECGKEVSEEAKICPNCGVKTPSKKRHQIRTYMTIALILAFLGVSAMAYHSFTSSGTGTGKDAASPQPKIQPDAPVKDQVLQKDYKDKVSEMLDSGKSVNQISKETGIRKDVIRKIKKEKTKADKGDD